MRLAVPNKGRLHDPTVDLLERAGLHLENGADRRLYAATVDPDVTVLYVRTDDIPEYVADGAADLGITGLDQVREAGVDNVEELVDLGFGRCRLVLAAPEDGDVASVADLEGGTVATEFPHIARSFFAERGVDASVVEVSGATELTPHVDMADAIIDITSTGTTLTMNRLAVVEEVLESSVRLYARDDVVDDEKTQQLAMALRSVIDAEGKRYLMMNAPRSKLDTIRDVLPGLGGPTVMDIAASEAGGADASGAGDADDGEGMVAVHAVVDEREVFETINNAKAAGASGILVTEIERLVE